MATSQSDEIKTQILEKNKLPKPSVSPAYYACLEQSPNTKSKYSCSVGTAGLCGFVALLLL